MDARFLGTISPKSNHLPRSRHSTAPLLGWGIQYEIGDGLPYVSELMTHDSHPSVSLKKELCPIQSIFDPVSHVIYFHDLAGIVIEMNHRVSQSSGLVSAEIFKTSVASLADSCEEKIAQQLPECLTQSIHEEAIVSSASMTQDDIAKSFSMGADGYVIKSISSENLFGILKKQLHLHWIDTPNTPAESSSAGPVTSWAKQFKSEELETLLASFLEDEE